MTVDKVLRLEDISGKAVYMAFFDSQNPASQAELGMIGEIYENFKSRVEFIAVSVDKDINLLREYLELAELPWQVYHFSGNLELLEDYDAVAFPHFVLIDGQGRIVRCPAPSPSENIGRLLISF
jgi:hypothetical protein